MKRPATDAVRRVVGNCDACGAEICTAMTDADRTLEEIKILDVGKVAGCTGCGHAMILTDGRLRRLTRDEAARVASSPWFEGFKEQREGFLKGMIG